MIRKFVAALRRFDEYTLEFICDVLMVVLMVFATLLFVVLSSCLLVVAARWALAGFPL